VLCRLIREAGFVPAQRNNVYDVLRAHIGAESPDLRVTNWADHRLKRLHVQREDRSGTASLTVSAKS
jgi:cyclic dehypoxanthinyl futalosine synthase